MDLLDKVGPKGFIAGQMLIGLTSNVMSFARATQVASAAQGSMVRGWALWGTAIGRVLPQFAVLAGGLYLLHRAFDQEGSPKTYQMPSVMADGLTRMGVGADSASPALRKLGENLSAMRAPVADLDVEKVTAFGNSIGQMGFALKGLPKENVVAVTNVIRETRYAGALGPAATARAASAFAAQGAAVVNARQAAAPAGGGGGNQGPGRGVFITDRVQFQIGGHLIERTVEDITNRMIRSRTRSA